MKTILLSILLVVTSAFALAAEPSNLPMVTAATLSNSKKVVGSGSSASGERHWARTIGVSASWRFFRMPKEAFELQCFFVAKDEADKSRNVFAFTKRAATGISGRAEFRSPELAGSGTRWTSVPFSGTAHSSPGGAAVITGNEVSITGTLTTTSYSKGSKIEGWIVRVVSGGKVVRILSNQSQLEDMAKNAAATLDAIAAESKEQ